MKITTGGNLVRLKSKDANHIVGSHTVYHNLPDGKGGMALTGLPFHNGISIDRVELGVERRLRDDGIIH